MTQVVDKKPADPILVDLCDRFYEEYHNYQHNLKRAEYEYKKSQRALNKELRTLVGLQPYDKVIYNGEEYIIEDISMPFLAEDEKDRIKVYITMHKPHRNYSCVKLLFNENEEIIKL